MKTKILALVLSAIVSSLAFAGDPIAVCPAEGDLTAPVQGDLAAVMRAYRDHLNLAEEIITAASRGDEKERMRMPIAINEIQKTIDCAAFVARNFNGSMKASAIAEKPTDQQQKFLDLYKEMCTHMLKLLQEHRDYLKAQWAKPAAEQNYSEAVSQGMSIHSYENQAHRKF